jgi:hypothetical protein
LAARRGRRRCQTIEEAESEIPRHTRSRLICLIRCSIARVPGYCACCLTPAISTASAHSFSSAWIRSASSAGLLRTGSMQPGQALGEGGVLATSAATLSMIGFGVCVGAIRPFQVCHTSPVHVE